LTAREKVGMALVYPLIVTLVGIAAILFMMIFVIPRFSAMFEELGGTLPLPTRILIGLSAGLLKYGWALAIGLAFAVVAARRALRTPAGREWKDRLLLRLPVAGNIVRANAFANFAHTLGTLLANGVQVLQALSIVENTVGNALIAKAIHAAKDRVTDGSSISRPLAQGGAFPRLLTDMLAVGEESGDMTGALEHIGRRYDNELDRAVRLLTTVLEPVMMLLIAVGVGFVAISMLMAVFELTSGLNA
jgi:type II secretory pathway component PulF